MRQLALRDRPSGTGHSPPQCRCGRILPSSGRDAEESRGRLPPTGRRTFGRLQMAESQWDHATQVREALRAIVAEHGQEALSNARLMQGLMGDLLPNAPREAQVLLSAAEQALAGTIHDHVAHGMDSGTAVRLAATSFAARTMFAPEVCRWVAGELATAVGIEVEPEPPLMSYQPIVAPEPGASAE